MPAQTRLDNLGSSVHLRIFRFANAEDIIQLWHFSDQFKHSLRADGAISVWDHVREAAGMRQPTERRRPTPDELTVLEYALIEQCQACGARDAVRQWVWGTRLCHRCLPSRVVTRKDFLRTHGTLFRSMPQAVQAMAWANPAHVAGMEATRLASNAVDTADGAEDPNDIIIREWANAAVATVHHVREIRKESPITLIEEHITGLIRGESWWARERLASVRTAQEDNTWEIERQVPKRADRITSLFLDMKHFKFILEDVPHLGHPGWRRLVYKGTELTAADFASIRPPLLKAVKRRRDVRLALILQDYLPPTPSSVSNPGYHGVEPISGMVVGRIPVKVFLDICTHLDFATISALEQTSRKVCSLLRSPRADYIWRSARLSIGLKVVFEGWPEKAFLAFALSRTCTRCGQQEGCNIPRMVSVLCGDCFELELQRSSSPQYKVLKPFLDATAGIPAGPYVDAGWFPASRGSYKLVKTHYAAFLNQWARQIPKSVRKMVPDEVLVKYITAATRPFFHVAKQCEIWQSSRDPEKLLLAQRREAWILHKVGNEIGLDYGALEAILQSAEWKSIVQRDYPVSRKEWPLIKNTALQVLGPALQPTT